MMHAFVEIKLMGGCILKLASKIFIQPFFLSIESWANRDKTPFTMSPMQILILKDNKFEI